MKSLPGEFLTGANPYMLSVLEREIDPALTDALEDYRILMDRVIQRRKDRQPSRVQVEMAKESEREVLVQLRAFRPQIETYLKGLPNGVSITGHVAFILDQE